MDRLAFIGQLWGKVDSDPEGRTDAKESGLVDQNKTSLSNN